MDVLAELVAKITADNSQLIKGIDQSEKKLSGFGQSVLKHSKAIGAGMTVMGGAIVGGLGLAMKSASDFEGGMREVNTMMGLSEAEFAALSDQVLKLSRDMGVSATGATGALYQAISAGVPKDNVLDFLAIASKAAIGGVTETETAVDGLTTVINAFGMDISDAQRVADVMFTTVKGGKTTFEELAASMFNVAPMASNMGVGFEEVSAALASMTKQGVPTAQATTQLRAAMQALMKPTAEMIYGLSEIAKPLIDSGKLSGEVADTFKRQYEVMQELSAEYSALDQSTEAGKKRAKELEKQMKSQSAAMEQSAASLGQSIIESQGLVATFEDLNNVAGTNTNLLAKMYGSVEGLGAVLALTGDNAEGFRKDLEAMTDSTGASTDAFNEMEKGTSRQFAKMKEKIMTLGITIGQKLLPIITPLIEKISSIVTKIGDWMEQNPGLTRTILIIVGALGGLMVVLGPILMILPGIIAALPVLGVAFAALLGPVGIAIAAIAALIAIGVLVWKNWDTIKEKAKQIWEAICGFFENVWTRIKDIFSKHWRTILAILFPAVGIPMLIAQNWGKIVEVVRGIFDKVKETVAGAVNWVIDKVNSFISFINKIPGVNIGEIGQIGGGQTAGSNLLANIPGFQRGGVVRQPTVGLIGERGPEVVIPIDEFNQREEIKIELYLDGQQITDVVERRMDRRYRLQQPV